MDCHSALATGDHQKAQIFGFVLGTCHADEHLDIVGAPYPEKISLDLLARIAWRRHAPVHIGDPAGRDAFISAYKLAFQSTAYQVE